MSSLSKINAKSKVLLFELRFNSSLKEADPRGVSEDEFTVRKESAHTDTFIDTHTHAHPHTHNRLPHITHKHVPHSPSDRQTQAHV